MQPLLTNMNIRTPLRAALRRQSGLLRPNGQACRRFASSSPSSSSSSLRTGSGSNEKRWQYGAITFLTLSTLFLSRSLVHSDTELDKRRSKSEGSESKHDDPYNKTHHPDSPQSFPHATPTEGLRMISSAELSNHDTEAAGYWVAIDGVVWDVTEFIQSGAHPGGSKVLAQNTGRNATGVYKPLHPPGTIEENLDPKFKVGIIDPSEANSLAPEQSEAEKKLQEARDNMMGVDGMVNLDDFEKLARTILSPAALAYYESGSDDEWTLHENNNAYRRIRFRPRVLRKVKQVDTSTEILGVKSTVPFFIAPAALAKLGHPDGEVNLTKGAAETGIVQVISSNASCSLEELAEAKAPDQTLMWQYYVAADRARAEKTLRKALDLGMQSIWLTVDAPVGGKRERDMKEKIARDPPPKDAKRESGSASTSAAQFAYVDPDLSWEDVAWIQKIAVGKPIVIKGISCVEDAVLALEHGCKGIVLSNHGGRQLDGARAPIEVLQEIRRERPDLCDKMEIYVDGGIRRGTDVLKALCLGAKAVGIGRPFLYAQSAYGPDGVVKVVEILKEEMATGMRLLGVNNVSELKPSLVDCLPFN